MGTQRRRPAGMTQHSGPSRAPRREAQAPRSGFLAPNPAKLATCVWEGEVQEEKQQASSAQSRPAGRAGRRVSRELRPELQGSGGRPWPTRRRTLLKGKGGPPRAPAPASRAPPRAGPRDGNKGAKRVSPQQPGRPQLELGSRSRDAAGHPGSRPPGWPFRPRKALPPPYPLSSYPGLSSQTAPSSSKQAAGRARPGRGPRVTRKPQAAQVEPGKRHRKSRASSLPFLRGDLVTGKREVPPTGCNQRTSGPRHAAPQA